MPSARAASANECAAAAIAASAGSARATNVPLAHRFIDHLLSVPVAVSNARYVHYATPNAAAFAKLDPGSAADPRIYPAAATLAKCQWLEDRGEEIAKIEAIWREVRA